MNEQPAVWFPAIRTNTGTDVFTRRLVKGLNEQGIKAGVTWLPLRAEYAPWTVRVPKPPEWADIVQVNTWLHPRFIPKNLPAVEKIYRSAPVGSPFSIDAILTANSSSNASLPGRQVQLFYARYRARL